MYGEGRGGVVTGREGRGVWCMRKEDREGVVCKGVVWRVWCMGREGMGWCGGCGVQGGRVGWCSVQGGRVGVV